MAEQQFDLFIGNPEAELVIQSQDINLAIDTQDVELAIENTEQQLVIENPIVELSIASNEPEPIHAVYEPWNKQGILSAFNAIKNDILTPTPTLQENDIINEQTLNLHKNALDAKLSKALGFIEYLVTEITR